MPLREIRIRTIEAPRRGAHVWLLACVLLVAAMGCRRSCVRPMATSVPHGALSVPRATPTPTPPGGASAAVPAPAPSGPILQAPQVATPAALRLDQTAPEAAFVGEAVTFEILVTNDGGAPAHDVQVRAVFDAGLVYELDPAQQDLTHSLGTLEAGDARSLRLTLRGTRAGTLCNRVELTAAEPSPAGPTPAPPLQGGEHAAAPLLQGQEPGEARSDGRPMVARSQACMRFVPPVLEVIQSAPTWRYRGSRADFNITITNLSALPFTGVRATAEFDPDLDVTAQTGGRFLDGRVQWDLGTLLPGQSQALQVEVECLRPADEACSRLIVTADGNVRRDSVACIEIRSAPAGLAMQMFDTDDLIPVGETTTYETRIANTGDEPVRDLRLVAVLAPQMELVEAQLVGGDEMAYTLDGRRVVFRAIETLEPEFEVVYRVTVRAAAPGDVRFRVERYVQGSDEPVVEEEPTTFLD